MLAVKRLAWPSHAPAVAFRKLPTNFHYKALINCMVLGEHEAQTLWLHLSGERLHD